MDKGQDVAELWAKLEHLRLQRLSSRRDSIPRHGEEAEQWKTRALVAEARLADVEKMLEGERQGNEQLQTEHAKQYEILSRERDDLARRSKEALVALRDNQTHLREEVKRSRAQIETLKNKYSAQKVNLERERELRFAAENHITELVAQCDTLAQQRDDALSEANSIRTKLNLYETEVLPRANDEQMKLEAQIQRLRIDLEETIEAESAFRTLFLQEQSNRRLRRTQRDERDTI